MPVSGAGYRGRFCGPGFDSIWTDMSEIVRPTRDGIHGREYISTSVDIGPKPLRLRFSPDGNLVDTPGRLLELQLPALLDLPAWPVGSENLSAARATAAKELRSVAAMTPADAAKLPPESLPFVVPVLGNDSEAARELEQYSGLLPAVLMAQLVDALDTADIAARLQSAYPHLVVCVRMDLTPVATDRMVELGRAGVKVFQLCADQHGRERMPDGQPGRHLKDAVRELHGRLVSEGLRDEITVIVSGGIALAEHMAKAIICGADLVAVDTPLLVALGCRVCRDHGHCYPADECPARIGSVELGYATQRLVNLLGAWHSQLLEMLGAMGIREVRRLRGEVGRAIFMEDIEKEAFGDLARVAQTEVCA